MIKLRLIVIFAFSFCSSSFISAQLFSDGLPLDSYREGEGFTSAEYFPLYTGPWYFLQWAPTNAGRMIDSIYCGSVGYSGSSYKVHIDSVNHRYTGYDYYRRSYFTDGDTLPPSYHVEYNNAGAVREMYLRVGQQLIFNTPTNERLFLVKKDYNSSGQLLLNSSKRFPNDTTSVENYARLYYYSSTGVLNRTLLQDFDGEKLRTIDVYKNSSLVDSVDIINYYYVGSDTLSSNLKGYYVKDPSDPNRLLLDSTYNFASYFSFFWRYSYNSNGVLEGIYGEFVDTSGQYTALYETEIYSDVYGNFDSIYSRTVAPLSTTEVFYKCFYKEVGIGIHEEESTVGLTTFPNPVSPNASFRLEALNANSEIQDVVAYRMDGKQDLHPNFGVQDGFTEVSTQGWTSGVYIVKVSFVNGESARVKLVVE